MYQNTFTYADNIYQYFVRNAHFKYVYVKNIIISDYFMFVNNIVQHFIDF